MLMLSHWSNLVPYFLNKTAQSVRSTPTKPFEIYLKILEKTLKSRLRPEIHATPSGVRSGMHRSGLRHCVWTKSFANFMASRCPSCLTICGVSFPARKRGASGMNAAWGTASQVHHDSLGTLVHRAKESLAVSAHLNNSGKLYTSQWDQSCAQVKVEYEHI